MKTRLAKLCDTDALAALHVKCERRSEGGLAPEFGTRYLRTYYRILMSEKQSVVLCTEDHASRIVGLASGTLAYHSEHENALARNRLSLLWAATPALMRSPSLLRAVVTKAKTEKARECPPDADGCPQAHFMFWCWDPDAKPSAGAIPLMQKWISLTRLLGAEHIILEVGASNENVIQIHRLLGARISRIVDTNERGQRYVMEYSEKR